MNLVTARTRAGARVALATGVVVVLFAVGAGGAAAVTGPAVVFSYTGTADQTYVVPSGVSQVEVTAIGAPGGASTFSFSGAAGNGGQVSGTIAVTPGERLYVEVGGPGQSSGSASSGVGGFNGGGSSPYGGGGGGASDVRLCPFTGCADGTASTASRLLVAGGGGGAGVGTDPNTGGNGGAADHDGTAGGGPLAGGGGARGTLTGPGAGGAGGDSGGSPGSPGSGADGGGAGGGSSWIEASAADAAIATATTTTPSISISPILPEATAPASLGFGTVTEGTLSAVQAVTVNNTGLAPLEFASASISGADPKDFFMTGTNCGSVAPGASCTVSVGFAPQAAGARSAVLTLTSNAPSSPTVIALSGTGIAPPPQATSAGTPSVARAPLFLELFQTKLSSSAHHRVRVSYLTTAASAVTLVVRHGRKIVARVHAPAHPGRDVISWSGRSKGHFVSPGRYTLTLTAVAGSETRRTTLPLHILTRRG